MPKTGVRADFPDGAGRLALWWECDQRFDRKRIVDYPNLEGLLREIYQIPGIAATVHLDHIRHHYFRSHPTVNSHGIISIGPTLDLDAPHGRERLGPREVRRA